MKVTVNVRTLVAFLLTSPLAWAAVALVIVLGAVALGALVLYGMGYWLGREFRRTAGRTPWQEAMLRLVPAPNVSLVYEGSYPLTDPGDPVPERCPAGGETLQTPGENALFGVAIPAPVRVTAESRAAIVSREREARPVVSAETGSSTAVRVKKPGVKALKAMDEASLLTLGRQLGVKGLSERMKHATLVARIVTFRPSRTNSDAGKGLKRRS